MEKLGRFERTVYLSLSDDEESKKAGETKQHKVTFVLEAGWTVEELVDRLLTVTTSPRVAFQNANRGKSVVPSTYVVPKAGSRATQVREMTDAEMMAAIIKKHNGDAAAIMAELNERLAAMEAAEGKN